MDNLRSLLGIRRMDRVLNTGIRELCGVVKGIDENVLHWSGHIKRMENNGSAERVYDRNECPEVIWGIAWGIVWGMNP